MSGYTDTRKLMMLLNDVSTSQKELAELAMTEIEQSEEYKILKSLKEYIFVTTKAFMLKINLEKVDFQNKTMEEIYEEYDKLKKLIDGEFKPLLLQTTNKIASKDYRLDIIHVDTYSKVLEKKNTYSKYVKIAVKYRDENWVTSFRKALKVSFDKEIFSEYQFLRTKELKMKDSRRQTIFNSLGAIAGFFALPFILQTYLENNILLMILTSGFGLLFILGLFLSNAYLRIFTAGAILLSGIGLFSINILQIRGKLPADYTIENIYEIGFLLSMACLGGLVGVWISNGLNRLPKTPFKIPVKLEVIHRYTYSFALAVLLFGYIWGNAFINNQTIFEMAAQNIQEKIQVYQTQAAIEKELAAQKAAEEKANQPVGKLEVTIDANVRTGPTLDAEKVAVAIKGDQYDHYGFQEDAEKRKWYKIKQSDRELWISENTVKIIN